MGVIGSDKEEGVTRRRRDRDLLDLILLSSSFSCRSHSPAASIFPSSSLQPSHNRSVIDQPFQQRHNPPNIATALLSWSSLMGKSLIPFQTTPNSLLTFLLFLKLHSHNFLEGLLGSPLKLASHLNWSLAQSLPSRSSPILRI
jgi:hypothetical protein